MSVSKPDLIKLRIKKASEDSPITVFKTDREGYFDAVFEKTVDSQRRIRNSSDALVGTFYSDTAYEFIDYLAANG